MSSPESDMNGACRYNLDTSEDIAVEPILPVHGETKNSTNSEDVGNYPYCSKLLRNQNNSVSGATSDMRLSSENCSTETVDSSLSFSKTNMGEDSNSTEMKNAINISAMSCSQEGNDESKIEESFDQSNTYEIEEKRCSENDSDIRQFDFSNGSETRIHKQRVYRNSQVGISDSDTSDRDSSDTQPNFYFGDSLKGTLKIDFSNYKRKRNINISDVVEKISKKEHSVSNSDDTTESISMAVSTREAKDDTESSSVSSSSDSSDDNSDFNNTRGNDVDNDDSPLDFENVTDEPPCIPASFNFATFLKDREVQGERNNFSFAQKCRSSVQFLRRFERHAVLEGHDGCVNCTGFNDSGSLLCSGSDDLSVKIWDWYRNRMLFSFDSGHKSNVFQSKFLYGHSDSHIVTASRDGQVRLAQCANAACLATRMLTQHKGATHRVAVSRRHPTLVLSAGEDGVVWQADVRTSTSQKLFEIKTDDIQSHRRRSTSRFIPSLALFSIDLSPADDNEFIVAGRDKYVRVYDWRFAGKATPTRKYTHSSLVNTYAEISCAVYTYDGSEIVASYTDDDIYLFDATHSDGSDAICRYSGHRNCRTVKKVDVFGSQSEFIVSGSDCGNIFFWEKSTGRPLQLLECDDGDIANSLTAHPNLPVLATSGISHNINIWLPTADEPCKHFKESFVNVARANRLARRSELISGPADYQLFRFMLQNLEAHTSDMSDTDDGEIVGINSSQGSHCIQS